MKSVVGGDGSNDGMMEWNDDDWNDGEDRVARKEWRKDWEEDDEGIMVVPQYSWKK